MTTLDIILLKDRKRPDKGIDIPFVGMAKLGMMKLSAIKAFTLAVGTTALQEGHSNAINLILSWRQQSK